MKGGNPLLFLVIYCLGTDYVLKGLKVADPNKGLDDSSIPSR